MVLFNQSYPGIIALEIENDAIYLLCQASREHKVLFKLSELGDNIKIQTLLGKSLFTEAQKIARGAKFPLEVVAEISKEHADNLYGKKLFEEAMTQYMETIGFLNPSYVIHKYIEVHKLPYLIKYLEKLINSPDTR